MTAGATFFLNPIELLAVLAAIAACILSIFVGLYPNVTVSSATQAYNLTVHNTASGAYSLKATIVVVVLFLPPAREGAPQEVSGRP